MVINDKDTYADKICQAAMFYNSNLHIIIIGIYRPPRADDKSFNKCLQKIDQFISKYDSADVQMLGDLNLPFVNWQTKEINRAQLWKSEPNCAEALLNFMEKHMLTQMVTENTRKEKSILDLVITNNSDAIHSIHVEKTEMSDHDFVWCNLLYSQLTKTTPKINKETDSPLDTVNLNKADWDAIRTELSSIAWENELSGKGVEEMNETINEKINAACIKHSPTRQSQNKNKLNMPPHRRSLIRTRRKVNSKINFCKYLKPTGYEKKLEKLNKKKAMIEISIRDSIREEDIKNEKAAIEKIRTNPRAFFTFANNKSKVMSSIGPLLDKNNKLQSDPIIMSNILQNQYQKAFSEPDSGETKPTQQDTTNITELNDIIITEEVMVRAIDEISQNSAPGPDKIPARLLKECKHEIAPALVILWRESLDKGEIPTELLKQTIIPIFKKDNRSIPSNYRPISLTSHIIKVFERILRGNIIFHLEKNNLITNQQHGFRQNRSTVTQLLHHVDSILEILEQNGNADIIYLDMAKAFDKVNHRVLLHKLSEMKITGKINQWIAAFLTKRTQYVVVNGYKSNPAPVLSGVPQGTVLGPALFIIYMNNITEVIRSTIISMFADDSKLIASIKDPSDRNKILEDLEALMRWTDDNSMTFNKDKFQLLQIGPNDSLKLPYTVNEIEIQSSPNVRDLGVYISENLSFKFHIAEMTSNASNFASWLLRTFRSRSKEVMLLLLKTFIIPRLEYASVVWNPTKIGEIQMIEGVQRSFTHKIENMENLDYWQRLEQLDLYSLQRRRERFLIIHTQKIYNGLAPNDLGLQFHEHPRLGTQCKRLKLNGTSAHVKTLRSNFFSHSAPKLYNMIPKEIKSAKTIETFKNKLDKLLRRIPDYPPTTGYARANNNSICEWGGEIHQARQHMMMANGGNDVLNDDQCLVETREKTGSL